MLALARLAEARRTHLKQPLEIDLAIPLQRRMRLEDYAFDLTQQGVSHAAGRTEILDELLREIAGAQRAPGAVRRLD